MHVVTYTVHIMCIEICTRFTFCYLLFLSGTAIYCCKCWFPLGLYSLVGFRTVFQILCHVLDREWGCWLRYFTEAKPSSGQNEWPVSILIMTRYPFLPFKIHITSAKNPHLLTIVGAIWFCRSRQWTPSPPCMCAPVAKECRLMTSQYPIVDRTDNLNPQWMQAVNG